MTHVGYFVRIRKDDIAADVQTHTKQTMVFFLIIFSIIIPLIIYYIFLKKCVDDLLNSVPNEPKCIDSFLSIFGFSITFLKNPSDFIQLLYRKYGKLFTVHLFNRRYVFLYDEETFIKTLIKDPKLTMEFLDELVYKDGFGMDWTKIRKTDIQHEMLKQYHQFLMGNELENLNQSIFDSLLEHIKEDNKKNLQSSVSTVTVNLFDFMSELMFYAGTTTLYGKTFVNEQRINFYQSYLNFNKAFPICLMQIPFKSLFLYSSIKKRDEYIKRFENLKINQDQSRLIQERIELFTSDEYKHLLTKHDIGSFHGILLFAAIVNTVPNACWSLIDILLHPEALYAVKNELNTIDLSRLFERETLNKLQILDSCINETLRRTFMGLTQRQASENVSLTCNDGTIIGLRKNDLLTYPSLIKHLDPQLFPQPYTFQYDRFIKQQEKKTVPSIMIFGCGKRMCPGRYWAINEIKMLVALVLTQMNVELLMDDWYKKKLCERLEYEYTGLLTNGGPKKKYCEQFRIKYSYK
ncbi:unnamed protein product [Didymodactylos carnosus]|uniref:Cytochrome P450 n=2 Tax=Didymodactylos carnosus TaxID=1234261 RepID=A0A815GWW5_9BILA|nr:unnamed protein product [Didymodactylos carnosus]CAF4207930.1 unnamed protein product [Didymodactylos carnosus]